MDYETVATLSQTITLFLFIAMFVGILIYLFWPSTKQKLDDAQHQALDLGDNQDRIGGRRTP